VVLMGSTKGSAVAVEVVRSGVSSRVGTGRVQVNAEGALEGWSVGCVGSGRKRQARAQEKAAGAPRQWSGNLAGHACSVKRGVER
jgi:hypothetical protein